MSVIAPPHPTHPNVQRSMSNVMKPQNTVTTKENADGAKKQERESAKNTVKTSANGQRQKTSLEETVVPARPRPPQGSIVEKQKTL